MKILANNALRPDLLSIAQRLQMKEFVTSRIAEHCYAVRFRYYQSLVFEVLIYHLGLDVDLDLVLIIDP